jgi:hypothetical protein
MELIVAKEPLASPARRHQARAERIPIRPSTSNTSPMVFAPRSPKARDWSACRS